MIALTADDPVNKFSKIPVHSSDLFF